MKSLQRAFQTHYQKSPNHSSYICFLRAVRGKKLTRRSVSYWFSRLVDPDDYASSDRNSLVSQLVTASQQALVKNKAISRQKQLYKQSVAPADSEASEVKIDPKSAVLEGFYENPSPEVDTPEASQEYKKESLPILITNARVSTTCTAL